jgi:glucose-1-phosphate cytidylyltransferase
MQVVILAGGLGSRLSEHTELRPKPMIEVGPHPMLWHIMKLYAHHGFNEFVIACGYKGEVIKQYFHNVYLSSSDYIVNLADGKEELRRTDAPNWRIAVVDTGLHTQSGGRMRRLGSWLEGDRFMLTYGDGVGNIDIRALVEFHRAHGRLATVTAVRPPARFGSLVLDGSRVATFSEKPQAGEGWINGGFFVFERKVLEYMHDDDTVLERAPLELLAEQGELHAYLHHGFWHPMDTLRDKRLLDSLWDSEQPPWKVWA